MLFSPSLQVDYGRLKQAGHFLTAILKIGIPHQVKLNYAKVSYKNIFFIAMLYYFKRDIWKTLWENALSQPSTYRWSAVKFAKQLKPPYLESKQQSWDMFNIIDSVDLSECGSRWTNKAVDELERRSECHINSRNTQMPFWSHLVCKVNDW